jgi:hypothetical protein
MVTMRHRTAVSGGVALTMTAADDVLASPLIPTRRGSSRSCSTSSATPSNSTANGRITVELHRRVAGTRGCSRLTITDTGRGIPQEHQAILSSRSARRMRRRRAAWRDRPGPGPIAPPRRKPRRVRQPGARRERARRRLDLPHRDRRALRHRPVPPRCQAPRPPSTPRTPCRAAAPAWSQRACR